MGNGAQVRSGFETSADDGYLPQSATNGYKVILLEIRRNATGECLHSRNKMIALSMDLRPMQALGTVAEANKHLTSVPIQRAA
jgi:hypothetical protein